MTTKGLFITVEGGEGVGKSTNLDFIRQVIESHGLEVVMTREPGGTPLAEEIREMLLQKREEAVESKTELLLMFAARSQHFYQKILPTIERGACLLSDRFTDATYAYQSGGRGVPEDQVALLEDFVQNDVRPDLTVLLDAPVEVGMERASKRGELDRFETEKLDFFNKVRNNYLRRAKEQSKRFLVVDATQPLDKVQDEIRKVLEAKLSQL